MNIYTDGSLQKKGSTILCGYGIHFENNEYKNIAKPFTKNPTSNRAELYAIYKALKICKNKLHPTTVNIFSDSQYSINIFNKWLKKWRIQNKQYLNADIIDKIAKILSTSTFTTNFIHVHAHTHKSDRHSLGNAKADTLARLGASLTKT